jgi:hypothetical protein
MAGLLPGKEPSGEPAKQKQTTKHILVYGTLSLLRSAKILAQQ